MVFSNTEYVKIGFSNSIYKDYVSSFKDLSSYYSADYKDLSSFMLFSKTNNISNAKREELVGLIEDYNKRFNASNKVIANIQRLKENSCFTIITGQQPGLLTGPLYTTYKAITAIKLADRLNNAGGKEHFVPIFWNASEDHDIAEVNRLSTQDDISGDIQSFALNIPYSGRSLDSIDISKELSFFLENTVPKAFKQSSFLEDILKDLNRINKLAGAKAGEEGATFAKHFTSLLSILFKERGLIIIEPYLFRNMQKSFNKLVIEKKDEINASFKSSFLSLKEKGYTPQINMSSTDSKKDLYLFYLLNGKRKKIVYDSEGFYVDNNALSKEALLEKIETEPYSFSHGVVLRPIIQDILFPNIATIAGPGEIAYFAQLKGIYNTLGKNMPIIYPRACLTLVEKKINKIKERFLISIEDLLNGSIDAKLDKSQFSLESTKEFNNLFLSLQNTLEAIVKEADGQGRDIRESINPSIRKIEHELKRLSERFIKKCEEKAGLSGKQINRLKNAILPKGRLQERAFNIFSYINAYGYGFVDSLYDKIDIKSKEHQVFYCE